jgi:hypothetical protein
MDPRVLPKHLLPRLDGLLGVLTERLLLLRALLLEPDPAITVVPAVGGEFRDLGVVVGVDVAEVSREAVAHDEELGVGAQAEVGDEAVQGEDVLVVLVEHQLAEGEGGGLEGGLGVAGWGVEGGARVGPAGVGPGCPLEVLEGYAEREAGGRGRAVVEDLLGGGGVCC